MKLLQIAALGAAASLSACGIGKGITLETLSIVPVADTTSTTTVASTKVFRCVRDGLNAYGTFSDGEIGNYTNRGHWSSSDENIVHVSNGDPVLDANPAQENTVFIPGTLTAIGPGTATVTFEYVGLQQSIQVEVKDLDPSKLTIVPANTYIAPGSLESLHVTADLDGVISDVSSSATWSFVTPNDAIATIGQFNGLVTGKSKTGGALTAKASFTACDIAPTTSVTVAPIKKLEFQREFSPALTELVTGTSEIIKVIASFEGTDQTQDLSSQATFGTDPANFLQFAVSIPNELIAVNAGGPVGVAAFFGPEGYDPVPAINPATGLPGFAITAVAATLNSVAIQPKNPTIPAQGTQQFKAIGTYDNGARTQEITRHVGWSSSDNTIAVVNNVVPLSGLAVSLKNEAGSVTITAVATASAQVAGDNATTLTISAPAP